jgi:hypothetical protein
MISIYITEQIFCQIKKADDLFFRETFTAHDPPPFWDSYTTTILFGSGTVLGEGVNSRHILSTSNQLYK